jgi:hypothetical protein
VLYLIRDKLQEATQWDVAMQMDIMELVKVTIDQNYFDVNNTTWQQVSDRHMGYPICSILVEIFLHISKINFIPM